MATMAEATMAELRRTVIELERVHGSSYGWCMVAQATMVSERRGGRYRRAGDYYAFPDGSTLRQNDDGDWITKKATL